MITKCIGKTAYRVDLYGKGLDGIHDIFHVSFLRPYLSNGLATEVPAVEIDGELEYEIAAIKVHLLSCGELQFLVSFVGYDASEDLWMSVP